jgi:hypothetical protein
MLRVRIPTCLYLGGEGIHTIQTTTPVEVLENRQVTLQISQPPASPVSPMDVCDWWSLGSSCACSPSQGRLGIRVSEFCLEEGRARNVEFPHVQKEHSKDSCTCGHNAQERSVMHEA